MKLIPIFPRHLGIKQFIDIPENILGGWKTYIESQPKVNLHHNPQNENDFLTENNQLLEDPIFSKLKNEILNYSKNYVNSTGFEVEDVQISSSWSYITTLNNVSNNFHFHCNSLISGVFYLTEGAPLTFKTDLHTNAAFKTSVSNPIQHPHTYFNINPQPGLLVLFPSHLEHGVLSNHEDIKRISIAFNIIPKGEFGFSHQKLYL